MLLVQRWLWRRRGRRGRRGRGCGRRRREHIGWSLVLIAVVIVGIILRKSNTA